MRYKNEAISYYICRRNASRPLGRGLFEVRSDISDKRIARVIFIIQNEVEQ